MCLASRWQSPCLSRQSPAETFRSSSNAVSIMNWLTFSSHQKLDGGRQYLTMSKRLINYLLFIVFQNLCHYPINPWPSDLTTLRLRFFPNKNNYSNTHIIWLLWRVNELIHINACIAWNRFTLMGLLLSILGFQEGLKAIFEKSEFL